MGKTRHRLNHNYDDDEYSESYDSELKRHRQEKRLNAALKRKNYDELMSITEKDDWD